jgi:tetratricopeptide (TPR) repeat protein
MSPRGNRLIIGISFLAAICLSLGLPVKAQKVPGAAQQQGSGQSRATLTVYVRKPDGTPLELNGLINLHTWAGPSAGVEAIQEGRAVFANLPVGQYAVEVIAPGYLKSMEQVNIVIPEAQEIVFVTLTPESSASANAAPAESPVLAPNAQKELSKALEAIRENKPAEARKHLEKLSRAAPANPDVNFLWGGYYYQINDWTNAKSYWRKALQIYPRHVSSLAALAQVALREGDMPAAIGYYGRAVEADPSSWRYQGHLADAYLQHGELEQAQAHAERAIELGKDRASEARLILAQALVQRGDSQRAITTLESFLAAQSSGPHVAEAHRLLDSLRPAAPAASAVQTVAALAPAAPSIPAIVEELAPPPKWMPPDVDESMPTVEPGVACPLQEIQEQTAKRVRDFIDAANRITATETLYNEVLDRAGFAVSRESRAYSYVASITEIRPGMLNVEEYRDGTMSLEIFPQHFATIGLPALVLIFHPIYTNDFTYSCEGLSRWHGGLAWQVHFRQKPDKPSRLRGYRMGSAKMYPVSLRGRAWIATDTFQVVSLETDIVTPIPEIRLRAEHLSIEYASVRFRKDNREMWLPQRAELFFDYGGRRMHRRHHFSNYLFFSVDEKEKISAPKVNAEADPPAP